MDRGIVQLKLEVPPDVAPGPFRGTIELDVGEPTIQQVQLPVRGTIIRG